ncbi:TPA: hypothetical protein EYO12_04130 [Candidatus Saccharibacteria bacterium]|nr:hypothetical protein [Candidatus Saccharibacteria bacterium]HIO87777.1 hypothetical protein [Candidatus Saccharibacteria bacterium]
MKKVQITGYGGSGKTTLANNLSQKLHIPHYEIDGLFWLENWQMKNTELFTREIGHIVATESWIICGAYNKILKGRIPKQADTIVVLCYPLRIIFWRSLKRTVQRAMTHKRLWGTNYESRTNLLLRPRRTHTGIMVRKYIKNGRYYFLDRAKEFASQRSIVSFNHPKELEQWLTDL